MFSMEEWIEDGREPRIMPAVYEFFRYLGLSKEDSFEAIIFSKKLSRRITFDNGSFIDVMFLKSRAHYLWKYTSLKRMKEEALRKMEKSRFSAVYGMAIYSNVAREIGNQLAMFSVGRIFGSLLFDYLQKRNFWQIYTRYYYQHLEAKRGCDLIVCTEDGTGFDRAVAKINPEQRLLMYYNGINTKLKEGLLSIKPVTGLSRMEPIRFLSTGRLTYWKRHDLAIRFFSDILHQRLNAKLTILGKGKEKQNLKRLAHQLGIEEKVTFLDPVEHHQICKVYENHDICLFMYDHSNLSNSMWEASLAGRLIVTRPTGKTNEVFKNLRNCIISKDENSAKASLLKVITENGENEIALNARETVAGILPSWKKRIEKELGEIRNLLLVGDQSKN